MKRFLSVLLVCVMLVGILPVFAAAATVEETTAANDSKATAQQTNFGDTMVGVLDGMFGDDIMDFYKFEMKESGYVNILALSENQEFGFRLDSDSGYLAGSEAYGVMEGYYCELLAEYYLEAGTYYLSFVGTSTDAFTYFFQVLETDGEAPEVPDETEPTAPVGEVGLSLGNPYPARFNSTYSYTWNYRNQSQDTYYARFTTEEPGYVELFCYGFTYYDNMIYSIYTEDGRKIWTSGTDEIQDRNKSLFVCLDPGTYIYAAQLDFYLEGNETYNADFFIAFYPEDHVAGEPNNTRETATEVTFGTEYLAYNGEVPQTTDYWEISMEKAGRVVVYLPEYYSMSALGNIGVQDAQGSSLSYRSGSHDGKTYIWMDLPAGSSYVTYSTDRYELMMDYTLRAELHQCESEDFWILQDPTCKAEGKQQGYCDLCGYFTEPIPKADHNWKEHQVIKEPTMREDGEVIMKCTECEETENKILPAWGDGDMENPFTDVTESDYFFEPVLWAFDRGVTTGTSATTFDPNATCTRAQVVTFLWRAAGSPEPETTECPFVDVELGSWYSKAVLWAAENGITTGTSATTFDPGATILREQFVTFLWRCETGGMSMDSLNCPFGDISPDAYYYDAVLWATQNGYCTGMGSDQFGPQGSCTRGQTVTFLYRRYGFAPVTAPSAIALRTRELVCTDMAYGGKASFDLAAQVLPAGAAGSTITWTTSDPSVATVSADGKVNIVGSGNATITAQCGNAVAYCRVTPADVDVTWFVDRAHHYVNNNLVVDSQLNPRAGTYLNSDGELCVITMIFAKVMTNGGWWDSRFITTVYNQTTGEEIRQPAEHYEKLADRAYGASKIKYLDLANEYLTVEINYESFTEYYQKGLEYGIEGYWVPVGQ